MGKDFSSEHLLEGVDKVVSDPLRFKARLEIGEQAYATLTLRNKAFDFWDVAGAASAGAKFAGSATIASTFFTSTSGGLLGFFTTATAVTPIGWIIGASVISGGAYFGLIQLFKSMNDGRVEVIPAFINTPIDVLAIGLFDLIAPLSLKIAAADGEVSEEELDVIRSYFIDNWGYDGAFVDAALSLFLDRLDQLTLQELTEGLRRFTLESKDCNHKKVRERVVALLREIAEADGQLHEMELLAINHVAECLPKDPWFQLPRWAKRS
ncbi:tellurite resistance TerB family protein, partial [Shimia marina]